VINFAQTRLARLLAGDQTENAELPHLIAPPKNSAGGPT
jgi:hypothetical protein